MQQISRTTRIIKTFFSALAVVAIAVSNPVVVHATDLLEATASVGLTIQEVRVAGLPTDNPDVLEGLLEIDFDIDSETAGDGIVTDPTLPPRATTRRPILLSSVLIYSLF